MLTNTLQEIKPGMIELMKPKLTFTQSEIQDGDFPDIPSPTIEGILGYCYFLSNDSFNHSYILFIDIAYFWYYRTAEL